MVDARFVYLQPDTSVRTVILVCIISNPYLHNQMALGKGLCNILVTLKLCGSESVIVGD